VGVLEKDTTGTVESRNLKFEGGHSAGKCRRRQNKKPSFQAKRSKVPTLSEGISLLFLFFSFLPLLPFLAFFSRDAKLTRSAITAIHDTIKDYDFD